MSTNAEQVQSFDAGTSFGVYVGGQWLNNATGEDGLLDAMREVMWGNPDGVLEGDFTVKVKVRMVRGGGGAIEVLSKDLVSFHPDSLAKERKLLVVHGNPLADRREVERPEYLTLMPNNPAA